MLRKASSGRRLGRWVLFRRSALSRLPLALEFEWGQVTERRVYAFSVVDVVEESREVSAGVVEVAVFGEVDFLLLDRPHESLGEAVLAWLSDSGHAERDAQSLESLDVCVRGVLHALIGVMICGSPSSRARSSAARASP